MAKMIKVTEVGGTYLGVENDTPRMINSDSILRLQKVFKPELGTTTIFFSDGKTLTVTETEDQIAELINGKPKTRSFWDRLFGRNK